MEEESPLTIARNQLARIKSEHPEVFERISRLPPRIKTAKASEKNQLIVLQNKALSLFIQLVDDTSLDKPVVEDITFTEMLPMVQCLPDEPRLDLSKRFWPAYEAVKTYRPGFTKSHSQNAVDAKAYNNLKSAVRHFSEELGALLPFTRLLIDDIGHYHTLPKHALRKLARYESTNKSAIENLKKVVEDIKRLLGEDYLDHAKSEARRYRNKIIIAMENQSTPGE